MEDKHLGLTFVLVSHCSPLRSCSLQPSACDSGLSKTLVGALLVDRISEIQHHLISFPPTTQEIRPRFVFSVLFRSCSQFSQAAIFCLRYIILLFVFADNIGRQSCKV